MAELGALSWAVISGSFYSENSLRASLTRISPNFFEKKQNFSINLKLCSLPLNNLIRIIIGDNRTTREIKI